MILHCSYGLMLLLGFPFNSITLVMPFLIIGISIVIRYGIYSMMRNVCRCWL